MIVLFSKDNNCKNLRKSDLIVFGFNVNTPLFLSKNYFEMVNAIKRKSLKTASQFILAFYVLHNGQKYVCGVRVKDGRVFDIFGECFTKKHLTFKICNKVVTILFYYHLYNLHGKKLANFSSLVIGLDNEPFDNLEYLNKKFYNKLILVGFNNKIISEKLKKIKNKTKMLLNIMYKI